MNFVNKVSENCEKWAVFSAFVNLAISAKDQNAIAERKTKP
jgi:hypothetical protein